MKFPVFSTRIWLAICAFLVTVVVILGVLLVNGPRGPQGPKLKLGKINRLDLTREKKQQVRQMFKEHRRSHRLVARELRQKERQLQDALVSPATTDEQLQESFAAVTALQRALARSRFAFTLQLRQLVGPANMKPLYRQLGNKGRKGRRGRNEHGRHRRGQDHRND